MAIENKGSLATTFTVSRLPDASGNFVCDGTTDNVEIQEALNTLRATGGEVLLLDGTYNIEVALVLDSYQTLRGCGRNTILTTTTADLDIITATGGAGTEEVGILIADLCIDGKAGGVANDMGILWTYVNYSSIYNVWNLNNEEEGINLTNCDHNRIKDNTIRGNQREAISATSCNYNTIIGNDIHETRGSAIYAASCNYNTITGNTFQGNGDHGVQLYQSHNNTITGNALQANRAGLYLNACDYNTITGNLIRESGDEGIRLHSSSNNTFTGNAVTESSQLLDNWDANISITGNSDYNLIEGNLCRTPTIGTTLTVGEPIAETEIAVTDTAGFEVGMGVVIDLGGVNVEYHRIVAITAGAPGVIIIDTGLVNIQVGGETIDVPEAQYGINISNDTCDKNVVVGNDLHDAGKTANFNDVGTLTMVRDDNRDIDVIQVKHYVYVKNTSGAQRVAGDVVIIKGIATTIEVATTVNQGDDKVYGMIAETIDNNASGCVLVKGFTAALKVDGTIDIAIDDILGTFTAACIAMKAAAGDQGFALALEAYAADDSNGVINAYLNSPWD